MSQEVGEGVGDLLPGEALGPTGEEPGAGVGEAVLAGGPGDGLDLDAAARAVDAAHGVAEDDGDLPERHEVEAAWRQNVVAGRGAPALRAPGPGPDAGPDADLEGQARGVWVLEQPNGVIDERRVLLDPIQDSLELHPVPLPRRIDVVQHRLSRISERDASAAAGLRDARVTPLLAAWAGALIPASSDKSRVRARARSRGQGRAPRSGGGAERSALTAGSTRADFAGPTTPADG